MLWYMLITPHNAVHYLLDKNLVTPESVVDGDLLVVDASRRNLNLKVLRRDGPSYFVKELRNRDAQSLAGLQREATVYWLARYEPGLAALAPLLPPYLGYDASRSVLVVELIAGGESLFEHYRRRNRLSEPVAAALGQALGVYHGGAAMPPSDSPHVGVFPKTPPWILSLPYASGAWFAGLSAANFQLMEITQRYPEFRANLDDLRGQWRTDSLIHGDIKWDNCLVTGADEEGSEPRLYLVDWELADIGDACWDLGAVLQGFVADWIMAMQLGQESTVARMGRLPEHAFEDVQPVLRAFWRAYLAARQATSANASELLLRSVRYGAARMIQTAYEYMQYAPQLSPNAVCLLQASADILKEPERAIRQLLGLRS